MSAFAADMIEGETRVDRLIRLYGDPIGDLEFLKSQVVNDGILLPYQRRYIETVSHQALSVAVKSRRIGITWTEAYDDVIYAATERPTGDDVNYIGTSMEMAREYIQACADAARELNHVCSDIGEYIFTDKAQPGSLAEDQHIKVYTIDFGSGNKIQALSQKPRSLRGRRGRVVLDEAAFEDDLEAMMEAAGALTIWGGQIRLISTHFGADNFFNQIVNEIRGGQREGVVYECDFEEAVRDGLFERIQLVKGIEPTREGKIAWINKIHGIYRHAVEQELYCVPSQSGGTYLSRALLERQAIDVPVVRWSQKPDFTLQAADIRAAECKQWCLETLLPILSRLDSRFRHVFGSDFARSGDNSVIWISACESSLDRVCKLVVELDNIPYDQQRQILFFIIDHLPRFSKGAMDATGNGEYLGEVTRQKYGSSIEAIKLSEMWYRDNMPPFKSGLEDGENFIPKDDDIIIDLNMFKVIKGIAKMPKTRVQGANGQRHGDAGIAAVLADYASRQDPVDIEHLDTGQKRVDQLDLKTLDIGFGAVGTGINYGGF